MEINPADVARNFREEVRDYVSKCGEEIRLVGLLSNDDEYSKVYSDFAKKGCEDVGVSYDARVISKFDLEGEIRSLNEDKSVTGVIVYYPIFGGSRDAYLRGMLLPEKDVEGLHPYWLEKLYANIRKVGEGNQHKAILPCTPLAVLKLLDAGGEMKERPLPLSGKTVTIFNRSEVVGRPLAFMMANDGARVYSFDIDGPTFFDAKGREGETKISRKEALLESDIVITGVPTNRFEVIRGEELKEGAVYVNFSSLKNYSDEVKDVARIFVPRVGPVTVAMCLRNVARLHAQYRAK